VEKNTSKYLFATCGIGKLLRKPGKIAAGTLSPVTWVQVENLEKSKKNCDS
jgi:hypothetical protein